MFCLVYITRGIAVAYPATFGNKANVKTLLGDQLFQYPSKSVHEAATTEPRKAGGGDDFPRHPPLS